MKFVPLLNSLSAAVVVMLAATLCASADLVVKDEAGNALSLIDAGATAAPDPRFINIRIENTGAAAAEGVSAAFEGSAAADFSVIGMSPTTVPAGSFVTAVIRFRPLELGARSAVLKVGSTSPVSQETAVNLSGIGSAIITPIIDDPAVVKGFTTGIAGVNYSLGTMTLNFEPVDQVITMIPSFPDGFSNVPQGGIVYGSHQGLLYPYRATYSLGPPPARTFTMKLSLAFGTAFPDFDAKLNGAGGSVAIQGDGKIIVTGSFTTVDGNPAQRIVRLNTDGSADPTFRCSLDDVAESIAVDPDNRILICGYFGTVNGVAMPGLARLNEDGSLDGSFAPPAETDNGLRVIALPDRKVLCSGGAIKRLNEDGSVDPTFIPIPMNTPFDSFAVQEDGRMVANADGLKRFDRDGNRDSTFASSLSSVTAIAVQPDGKIIVGGHFDQVGGVTRQRVARLNADGTLDSTFAGAAFLPNEAVSCVAVQEDGGVMISGTFSQVDGETRPRVARLKPDGTLDIGFAPAGNASVVTGMSLAADGSVFVVGNFSSLGSESRTGLAKLRNWPSVVEFGIEGGDTLYWKRTGSAPALLSVAFSVSIDSGHSWMVLPAPERSGDRWVLGGAFVPEHGHLRVSGGSVLSTRGFGMIQETKLFGREPTPMEEWRSANFGSPLDEGTGADERDFDHDGHANLLEYAFGFDPKTPEAGGLPQWLVNGSYHQVSFTKPPGVTGVNYIAEWSATLEDWDWTPAQNFSVGDQKSFRVPLGPEGKKFFRLRVTNP